MNRPSCFFVIAIFTLGLVACVDSTSYAPVVNGWQQPGAQASTYRVRKGDTVYSVAWAFGLDYRALAEANDLHQPYALQAGQRLRMTTQASQELPIKNYPSREGEKVIKRYGGKQKAYVKKQKPWHRPWVNQPVSRWDWPAKGIIAQGFSNTLAGNKGINIKGRFAEPIKAAAPGEVVYSGDGLRGYGNLLIIKHNDSYLSAYAFNKKLLVKLGERVRSGQEIAQMGRNNAGQVLLHFEIRHNGKPVDPMRYLRS